MIARADELAALGTAGLTALLDRRRDVLAGPVPRTLSELAQRLDSPRSVHRALQGVTVAHIQALAALCALGDEVDVAHLTAMLGADPRRQLTDLVDLALVGQRGPDRFAVHDVVRGSMPDLLELGPPFAVIAAGRPHRVLQSAEAALGLRRSNSKRQSVEALQRAYDDGDLLRSKVERMAPAMAREMTRRAWHNGGGSSDMAFDVFDEIFAGAFEDAEEADDFRDANAWTVRRDVDRIGLESGLLVGEATAWTTSRVMPAEVALALRGPGYLMAFHPEPPQVAWLPVSRVKSDADVAVAAFDAAATAVLDNIATKPLAMVAAGGVGARELSRLAKVTRVLESTVRMVIELADAAGLLTRGRPITISSEYVPWRESEPPDRFVTLATAWWAFQGRAGRGREPDGAAHRALTGAPCEPCRLALVGLVEALQTDRGLSMADAAELTAWHHPAVHAGDPPFGPPWQEAQLLGAIAQGARTAVGSALLTGDVEALRTAVVGALPASTSVAVFGSDLTAFVAGSPSARVSTVLDACARRESGGGAVTWRLSPASVRRAFDDGWTATSLLEALTAICSAAALPQAVTVLLDDVGRMYGRVRVTSAVSVIAGDDEALAAQLLHDRKLGALGLTAVSPTVLVSATAPEKLVAGLRRAGYMPAWTGTQAAAPVTVTRRSVRSAASVRARPPIDAATVARRLVKAPTTVPLSQIEIAVMDEATGLSDDEVHVLAEALEHRHPVGIVYEAASGGITERVITPREFMIGRIWAWCALRSDEREFAVARVLAVHAV